VNICREEFDGAGRSLATSFGHVDLVAAVMLWGVTDVPSIDAMRVP
jgi:hypothetical protein